MPNHSKENEMMCQFVRFVQFFRATQLNCKHFGSFM